MNETDHEPIVTVAFLAAMADGRASPEELSQLRSALGRLGMTESRRRRRTGGEGTGAA